MNQKQSVHIGMLNSYNFLTGRATIEQIVASGLGIFAHSPEEETELESINFMVFYFKEIEMYEKCAELKEYIDKTFNKDGSYKDKFCECELPEIENYTPIVKCSVCKMRIKR